MAAPIEEELLPCFERTSIFKLHGHKTSSHTGCACREISYIGRDCFISCEASGAIDSGPLKRFMGCCKYKKWENDPAKKEACEKALAVYESLNDTQDKNSFLASFEANGGGKGKGGKDLAWAMTFTKKIRHEEETTEGANANFLTRTREAFQTQRNSINICLFDKLLHIQIL